MDFRGNLVYEPAAGYGPVSAKRDRIDRDLSGLQRSVSARGRHCPDVASRFATRAGLCSPAIFAPEPRLESLGYGGNEKPPLQGPRGDGTVPPWFPPSAYPKGTSIAVSGLPAPAYRSRGWKASAYLQPEGSGSSSGGCGCRLTPSRLAVRRWRTPTTTHQRRSLLSLEMQHRPRIMSCQ